MRVRPLAAWMVVLASVGCGSDPVDPPAAAVALFLVTQPAPTAASGVPLSPQPVVELRDAQGNPAATRGVQVTAAIAAGGGALSGESSIRTDAAGRAAFADLAIVGAAGPRTLRFTSSGLSPATSASVDVAAGNPASLTPAAGNNQTAPAGTAVVVAPAVLVQDGAGNPVAGVDVVFTVVAGDGEVDGGTVVSDADGKATAGEWRLGTAVGPNTLRADAAGLQFDFSATGIVGPAAKLAVVSGDGQSGTIGTPVAIAPVVRVTDQFDNPIAGVAVTFAVSSGGGTLTAAVPNSDQTGLATLGSWTLGLVPGAQTITASRDAVPPVTITATGIDFQVGLLAAGGFSSCAIAGGNQPFCWGANAAGQLGDGTIAARSVPAPVQGSPAFTRIVVGPGHGCGLTAAGIASCWGSNFTGQLGDGTASDRLTPVAVTGGLAFKSITVGDLHTCALDLAGAAWCWGSNANGRLGDGNVFAQAVPVPVQGGHTFTAIAAGAAHTCGLRADGQVLCWGLNSNGQLGDGFTLSQPVPTLVASPPPGGFAAIALGNLHTCALDGLGNAYCWGRGAEGQLGTGTNAPQLLPANVTGALTFSALDAGTNHTCGVVAGSGQVQCWGQNQRGQLGDGTLTTRLAPVPVSGTLAATAVSLGGEHTCARTTAGSAVCWGRGLEGQLGDNGTASKSVPVGVVKP